MPLDSGQALARCLTSTLTLTLTLTLTFTLTLTLTLTLTRSPRLALKDAVSVEPYLQKVRELLKDCEELRPGGGATYEEIALDVLNELQYEPQEALDALQLCVAWRHGDEKAGLALEPEAWP